MTTQMALIVKKSAVTWKPGSNKRSHLQGSNHRTNDPLGFNGISEEQSIGKELFVASHFSPDKVRISVREYPNW